MPDRFRRLVAAVLSFLALVTAAGAMAAPNHITAGLVVESAALPGETVLLAVHMRPAPGWHGYWRNPGDAGLGIILTWDLPKGASTGALQYPVPTTLLLSGLMNHVYEHDYAVLVPFHLPRDAAPGSELPLKARAEWLACTDKICVPESAELSGMVRVGDQGQRDPRFDAWQAALPAPLGSKATFALAGNRIRLGIPLPASVRLEQPHLFVASDHIAEYAALQAFSRRGDLLIVELERARIGAIEPGSISALLRLDRAGNGVTIEAQPGAVPAAGEPLEDTGTAPVMGLPYLLLSALLGGLLLNVMPCVFPILSLKALSLARAGESQAQARVEGLAYTAGVMLACLALGVLLLGLRAAGQQVGWAFQLQEPLVVAGLLLLAVAITANLLGVFEMTAPGLSRAGSPQGAFATGLLAAFAATPCTGPFMAVAMGAALLLPAAQALALFAALGLGIALPFLAIAEIAPLRRMLPRPGAWMNRFRTVMAVPIALTGAALVWLSYRLAGSGFAFAAVLVAIVLVAILVLLGRRQRHGRAGGMPVWASLAGLIAFAALGLPGMVRAPQSEASSLLPTQPFSEQALAAARAQGKPVFLYFTADWCLTCKVNEAAAIEREETRAQFERSGVVVLRGDWTRRDPAITRFLTSRGAAGVPLYLWYPVGGSEPQQLPQILTPAMLADLAR